MPNDPLSPDAAITTFAWTAIHAGFGNKPKESEILCAWCKKSREDISKTEDPNNHIEKHAQEDQEKVYFNKQIRGFLLESNAIEDVWDEASYIQAKKAWDYLIKQKELSREVILKTHKILMKGKLERHVTGAWRKEPVWIGGHEAKPWYAIQDLMDQWIQKANHPLYQTEEGETWFAPDKQFQDMHVEFESIHPFIDGNGRIGRMLFNWQRIKAGLPVLVILEAEKEKYYAWFR